MHVQITIAENYSDSRLTIDGVDITKSVAADGVMVNIASGPRDKSRVHLVLLADVLDLDIADADIEAEHIQRPRLLCGEEA